MGFEELSSSALVLFPLPVLFINNCTNDLLQCCESTTPKVLLLPTLMLVNETGPGRAVGTLCAPSAPSALVWPTHPLQEPRWWPNIAFGFSVGALSWPVCFPTVDGTHQLMLVSSCCYFSHYFKSIQNIIFTCHYFYLQLFLFSQQCMDIYMFYAPRKLKTVDQNDSRAHVDVSQNQGWPRAQLLWRFSFNLTKHK